MAPFGPGVTPSFTLSVPGVSGSWRLGDWTRPERGHRARGKRPLTTVIYTNGSVLQRRRGAVVGGAL